MSSLERRNYNKLPHKYANLFAFGYWFINEFQNQHPEIEDIRPAYLSRFQYNGDVNRQITAFNDFWIQRKEVMKIMNKNNRGRPRKKKEIIPEYDKNSLLAMLIAEAEKEVQGPCLKTSTYTINNETCSQTDG